MSETTAGPVRLLSMQDLADRFQVPLQTIRRWRVDGYGPAGFPVGRYVRYRLADVEAWEAFQLAGSAA